MLDLTTRPCRNRAAMLFIASLSRVGGFDLASITTVVSPTPVVLLLTIAITCYAATNPSMR